jgi:hypothetical protein
MIEALLYSLFAYSFLITLVWIADKLEGAPSKARFTAMKGPSTY